MKKLIQKLGRDTRGASFVEYVVLVGLVAIICIAVYQTFGEAIAKKITEYTEAVEGLQTAAP